MVVGSILSHALSQKSLKTRELVCFVLQNLVIKVRFGRPTFIPAFSFNFSEEIYRYFQLESYGWMIGCSSPGRGWEFFSPPLPDRLWSPPSLLSNRYQGLFPWG
jgi:hypothetical protein